MAVNYIAWLENPDNVSRRNLLVDAKAYSGGGEVPRKMSRMYAPKAGPYHLVLGGFPVFDQRMTSPFSGRTESSIGVLEIINAAGMHDDWLFDSWGGRDITLRLGDVDWDYADYEPIRVATTQYIEAPDPTQLRLVFNDPLERLNKTIQLNTVDDGRTGKVEIPLCYGPTYQIQPKLLNDSTFEYQMHDGAVEDVSNGQIFINGDHNVLSYTEDLANGKIDLSSKPDGIISLVSKGAKPGGVYITKPAAIIRDIITTKGGLADPAEIDTAAFTAFDAGAPDIGLYIDSPRNILDVLDEIMASVGGWYGMTRDGKFTLGYIAAPTAGASIATLRASKGQIRSRINVTPMTSYRPRYRTRISHTRAWTKNTSTNPNINEDHREWFRIGHKVAEYTDTNAAAIQAQFADAEVPEVEHTLISGNTEAAAETFADAEAQRRQGIFNTQRYFCDFEADAVPFQFSIGDVITVYDDTPVVAGRYGFDAGREIVITGIEEHLGRGGTRLEGWF